MDTSEILSKVDHTVLKATATWADIETLCKEAKQYKTASVCIPPAFVKEAAAKFGESVTICTVIGFPLGYNETATKVFEATRAVENGAKELDMVVNLGDVKAGNFQQVTAEIQALKKVAGKLILKVIVETCYLTEKEKIKLCGCVTEGGADYIKTSTGFGSGGATVEDIKLFRAEIGKGVKIKASGGIRSKEDFADFAQAGCDRIGASAAIAALVSG